jgi:hypothetical protein
MPHDPHRSRVPTPPPHDLPRVILHRGLVCLDGTQPLSQCAATTALLTATLAEIRYADIRRLRPSWVRWYTALAGGN